LFRYFWQGKKESSSFSNFGFYPDFTFQVFDDLFGNCQTNSGSGIFHPLEVTFWNALFGDLTDKFGINWLMHYQMENKELVPEN